MNYSLPTDTKLDEFPHPNPCFPTPPRYMKGWTWKGMVVLALTAALSFSVLAALASDWFGMRGTLALVLTLAALLGLLTGSIGGALALNSAMKSRQWRRGRIIPARLVRPPRKLPWYLHAIDGVSMLFGGGMFGLMVGLLFGAFRAKVEYVSGGVIHRRTIWCRKMDDSEPGSCHWITPARFMSRAGFLYQCSAPKEWQSDMPPDEVKEWLNRALEKADRQYSYRGGTYDKRA